MAYTNRDHDYFTEMTLPFRFLNDLEYVVTHIVRLSSISKGIKQMDRTAPPDSETSFNPVRAITGTTTRQNPLPTRKRRHGT